MSPSARLRRPVPAAVTPHGLQLPSTPTRTSADTGDVAGRPSARTTTTAWASTSPGFGARHWTVAVAVLPGAMSGSGTSYVDPGAGELGVPLGVLETNDPTSGSSTSATT